MVSQYRGKKHSGWAMPPNTPSEVSSAIIDIIERETVDIRESVVARRHSNSFPSEDREDLGDLADYCYLRGEALVDLLGCPKDPLSNLIVNFIYDMRLS